MSDATETPIEVEYREIPKYPGYRFGSDGSVWSTKRPGNKPKEGESRTWRQLKTTTTCSYPQVSLHYGGERKTKPVHILIMLAFYGPPPDGYEVAHENGQPADNRLTNLSYKTKSENQRDRIRHGTHSRGQKNTRSKLTNDQVLSMRTEYDNGSRNIAALARKYGVARTTASGIINRTSWFYT